MEEDESSFTVLLEAHDKDPWGASVNFDDDWKEWRVKTVDRGQQAWRKCVESGFRILSVNGMPLCPKHLHPIRDILSNGRRCEVEFDTTNSGTVTLSGEHRRQNTRGSLFTPKQARKWRLNSLENEESAMSAAMARMIRTHSSQIMDSELPDCGGDCGGEKFEDPDASGAELPPAETFDPLEHQCFGFSERESELEYLRGNLKLAWKEIRELQESKESLQDLVVTLNSRMNHLENLLTAKLQTFQNFCQVAFVPKLQGAEA